jgi:hypothetical protein
MVAASRDTDLVLELLAGEAAGDLSRDEARALTSLRRPEPLAGSDQLMTAAGLAQLHFLRADRRGAAHMPDQLQARLMQQAAVWSEAQRARNVVTPIGNSPRAARSAPATARRTPITALAGWAAAALLALAFVVFRADIPGSSAPSGPAQLRADLLRTAPDAVTVPWARPSEPGYERVAGDVVWSNSRQQGYLRLAGLPANDPSRNQYQLWIVDPDRDVHPVDGGVFNVSATGEVIVAIQAKLAIGRPSAFAITLEQPGGVVVSKGPLLVVAAIGS